MTEVAEPVLISLVNESSGPCWYCEKDKPSKKLKNDLEAHGQTNVSEDVDAVPENDLGNSSSKLGDSLGNKPDNWDITNPDSTLRSDGALTVKITPAAHHCIPGNASLKRVPNLISDFMSEGGKYAHNSDIGYDVNSAQNGVWLPGNYNVRVANGWKKTWSVCEDSFIEEYTKKAMDEAKCQFHDAHDSYSDHVIKTLENFYNELSKRKAAEAKECPVCKKSMEGKEKDPPFGLVAKLNKASNDYRNILKPVNKSNKKSMAYVKQGYVTSWSVKIYYGVP